MRAQLQPCTATRIRGTCLGLGRRPQAVAAGATRLAACSGRAHDSAMTRRHFLRAAAAGAAAAACSVPAWAKGPSGIEPSFRPVLGRPIRVGLLGAAHSHALAKWRILERSGGFECVGISEEDARVREAFARPGVRFLDARTLVERSDALVVESDVADHARHALMALGAGKHAHVEKPPSHRWGDVERMVGLARRNGVVFQTGYMWRHHPGLRFIFDAVAQGWLGHVHLVRATIGNALEADRRPEWGRFPGGGLFELGSHCIDAVVRLLGKPRRVTSFLRRDGGHNDRLEDNNLAVLEYPRCMALVCNSNLDPMSGQHREFHVEGSLGSATLRPVEPPTLTLELSRAVGPWPAGRSVVPLPPYERYEGDLAEWAACIRGEATPTVSGDVEIQVQNTLLRACRVRR